MSRHPLKLLAAGLGGCLIAASTFAAPAPLPETPVVHVSYAELDLAKDAGVERLYTRLRHAADDVCGHVDGRDLAIGAAHDACVREALDRAVDDVHSARLSARHYGTHSVQFARLD
ncbi:MAG: UrcA family protein [Proteobacteria bacterium]|nr:UrcA family protein [Pseudomonadota bacterium]